LAEKQILPNSILNLCNGQTSHFATLFSQVLSTKQKSWICDFLVANLR